MGGVVEIGRDLDGELASRAQPGGEASEQFTVVGHPLQAGVGEDDVEGRLWREVGDVPVFKRQTVTRERTRFCQHRLRGVDPERCGRLGVLVQPGGEFPGAAAEIHHLAPRNGIDHGEEVEERFGAFGGELCVLTGIPVVGRLVGLHRPPGLSRAMSKAPAVPEDIAARKARTALRDFVEGPAPILKAMTEPVPSPPGEIVLEEFVLRRYQQKDAPALARAVCESLEHLRPWMPWISLEPTSLGDREKLLAKWDEDWAEGTQYSFGIFQKGRVSWAELASCAA